jgi:hypothetical protein
MRKTWLYLFARDQNYSNYLHFVDNKYPVCYKTFLLPDRHDNLCSIVTFFIGRPRTQERTGLKGVGGLVLTD